MNNPQRSIPAAVTLFFVAPLVAEFLLGDLPITLLSALILLAPFYGGGALLIRELTRRSGHGWPTILLLGAAYALLEEGLVGQSLFNPNYLGMKMHLLSHAWIPSLGIGAWWTLFMLNVHPFWSIGASIALVEGLFPRAPQTPWLGKVGTGIAAVVFAAGVAANAAYTLHHDPFRASPAQFAVTGLICVLLIAAAFLIPAPATPTPGPVPSPWLTAAATFLLGGAIFLAPFLWNWGAVWWILAVDALFLFLLWFFSRRSAWTPLHTFSIGAAAALFYGVHAFMHGPLVGGGHRWVILFGHAFFLALAFAVIALSVHRIRAAACPHDLP
jgi:hypothetical protein